MSTAQQTFGMPVLGQNTSQNVRRDHGAAKKNHNRRVKQTERKSNGGVAPVVDCELCNNGLCMYMLIFYTRSIVRIEESDSELIEFGT